MTAKKQKKSRKPENPDDAEIDDIPKTVEESAAAFPIVGIGASAGGLAAIEAFFSAMPADPDMAFVLVQHLAPDHKSMLTDLIKRYTKMKVFEVEDGMVVQPNCAYIIPPNRDMAFLNGTLQLLEPNTPRGQRLPIDFFFRSLAQDQNNRAICIILSGTGSDGTHGLKAIKGEGGMAMAQVPESTEYDGMPRSAIATGMVDYILPPAEMPAQLISYVTHAFGQRPRITSKPSFNADDALKKIFILLRAKTGHDFSHYKPNTINRRIERRMAVHKIERLDEYVRYLQQSPDEVNELFRDLLIGVTNFFRDPEAYKILEETILPRLFKNKKTDAGFRIWVPGCSTGEEAYSIAILIQEKLDAMKHGVKVQIFATDIDSRAIDTARTGIYSAGIAGDISPERLARFFIREPSGDAYRIQKSIRDMMVFSEQDVIKDPPFSRLDLISCRNLLIYMGGELQKKLIPLFHYALKPGGFMFLGTSETIGDYMDLFAVIDRKSKLFQRKADLRGALHPKMTEFMPPLTEAGKITRLAAKPSGENKPSLREITENALLQHWAPVGALINERGDILYLHGRAGLYLEPCPGEAGVNNILKMARDGLRRELTTAVHKVATHQESIHRPNLKIKTNGHFTYAHLTVRPIHCNPSVDMPRLLLVVLEESRVQDRKNPRKAPDTAEPVSAADIDGRITALKQELRNKEEYLQSSNEELETSNEELKSANEELQSVNEELQSTNEELETSKEEQQSVNEELSTVNAELQAKVADLARANNDMKNLLAGTGIGTIFVDHQLRILRFTPAVTQIINLIATDVGRPVSHIVSNLTGYDRLTEDVHTVLNDLAPKEIEVQTHAGVWYLMRICPYRTLENVIEGAVITFVDITETKQAQMVLRDAENLRRLAVVVRDAYDAITVFGPDGSILAWNPSAERMYGWSESEALKMNIRDMLPKNQRTKEFNTLQKLGQSHTLAPYSTRRVSKDGILIKIILTASALMDGNGKLYAIATTERVVA
ncbi:MAG: PAS domain S-box protein [Desulfobacteraceae bacterium]|nr:MAG: PAS domain S-box protein [Desulfobacteraceae bacterium]